MKKLTYIYLIFSILVFVGCSEELIDDNFRGTLKGNVRTEFENEPLKNVKITTTPSTLTVYTNENGNYEIAESLPIGDYTVKAELKGYVTEIDAISITALDQVVSVDFEMITDESLNGPPTTPKLITPDHLAVDVPVNVTLQWESSDPDNDLLTYRVLVSDSRTNTQQEFTEIEADTLLLENLHHATTYTWQVVVSDGINEEVFSSSHQFTTVPNSEFRYHFNRKEGGNYVIYSTDLNETIPITNAITSSWRPLKNNIANRVAYLQTMGGQTHLMTAALHGIDEKRISTVPINGFRNDQLSFDWHRDGSRFIFPSFDKLYMVNHDGTGEHQIYRTTDGNYITKVAWSYDGSKIALVTNDINGYHARILVINTSGMQLEVVLDEVKGAVGGLDWNIQGTKLLYTHDISEYEDERYRQLNTHIFEYDFTTNETTDYSELSEKPFGTIDLDPKYAPNDSQIIFTNTSNDGISQRSIYVMNTDGLDEIERNLLIEDGEMPDFQ